MKCLIFLVMILLIVGCNNNADQEKLIIANHFYVNHQYTSAINAYKEILSRHSKNFEILECVGISYREIGIYDTAYIFLDSAINCGDQSYSVFINAGDVAFKIHKEIESYNWLMIAFRKDSKGKQVNYNLGLLHWLSFNSPVKGLEYLSREISLYPQNALAFGAIGQIYWNIDSIDSAFYYYDKSIKIDSSSYEIYFERGLAWQYLNKYSNAIKDYNRSINLNPVFLDAVYYRGLAKLNIHEDSQAYQDFKMLAKTSFAEQADSIIKRRRLK